MKLAALCRLCAFILVTFVTVTSSVCSGKPPLVKCGIDNLIDTQFALLRGKRVVLVTHAAARAQTGRSTFDEFRRRTDVSLLRILTPEHGFYGTVAAGGSVANEHIDGVDAISLYGAQRKPSAAIISDADIVVIDLQDIGTRSYTFMSTMIECLESCAELNIRVMILDRPNPLGGNVVDGNVPEDSLRTFVARIPVAYVHGMTMGELATMSNGEGWLGKDEKGLPRRCSLTVVRCKRWTRDMRFEETGLSWYPTSPNIPTIHAARGYPVTGLLGELGGVYIGIGAQSPFTVVGAPSRVLDTALIQRLKLHGVTALQAQFVPSNGRFQGTLCTGYYLAFDGDVKWRPYTAALALIAALTPDVKMNDSASGITGAQKSMFKKVSGSSSLLTALLNGNMVNAEAEAARGLEAFKLKRRQYLLYP